MSGGVTSWVVGVVVEGLTRVVLEVVTLGVVRIVVEELTRVVPGVGAIEVVEIVVEGLTGAVLEVGALEIVGTSIVTDTDVGVNFIQSPFEPLQEYPGSQHPSKHWVDPGPHGFRHLMVPGMHSVPLGQQKPTLSVHL